MRPQRAADYALLRQVSETEVYSLALPRAFVIAHHVTILSQSLLLQIHQKVGPIPIPTIKDCGTLFLGKILEYESLLRHSTQSLPQ